MNANAEAKYRRATAHRLFNLQGSLFFIHHFETSRIARWNLAFVRCRLFVSAGNLTN